MVFSAKDVLHELPLLVPASTVLLESCVCLILDGVAFVKLPLTSSVFSSAGGMCDEAVGVVFAA